MIAISNVTTGVLRDSRGWSKDAEGIDSIAIDANFSSTILSYLQDESATSRRDSLYVVLPITVIYAVIFFSGVIGNVSTCVVIARNKSMHTATNYYLFSLAVSDLLLLVSGLPPEMYYIWSNFPYIFGEAFCIVQSFAAETSANATVLTITAFTVERYVAICHPFISHTMSKLSRAVKFVVVIWLLALCLAVPQAIQFGIIYQYDNGTAILDTARCSTQWMMNEHVFAISTVLFFALPMTIITVLYVLIAIKLRGSRLLTATVKRKHALGALNHMDSRGKTAAQRNVIRMLVAVVVAFFICWAPFHAQRLLAVYARSSAPEPEDGLVMVYTTLTYVSGVFYYLSTTVNPLLYNIMSNKFREAFKSMLPKHCIRKCSSHRSSPRRPINSSFSRYQRSLRYRINDIQNSPSISVSDEQQRTIHTESAKANFSELNGIASRNEQQVQPVIMAMLKDTGCREYVRSMSRNSDSSQLTTMTSISKQALNEGNNIAANGWLRMSGTPKAISLGVLTGKLGFSTKGFFSHHRKSPTNPEPKAETASAVPSRFRSQPSLESANTISNSSLQDLDETEFTGLELARYMGELNFDLVT